MTPAEQMREAAARACEAAAAYRRKQQDENETYSERQVMRWIAGELQAKYLAEAIRALPIPVDASAPAADCQQAGLVTVDAPQITIRHGRNNDPYPEGWTLCVADNSVTYKRGGHMDIYTIEKGFLAFAARKEVMPDADQIGDSKPATSPGVTAGAAGLLDEVKAADRISDVDVAMLQSMATSFRARMGFSFNPDDMADLLTRVSAALARLEREVG